MRHWKYLLIVAVVAAGYWTGYAMKRDRQTQAKPTVLTPSAAVVAAPMDPTPPAVDPNLILPPVPAQGAMIDIPIDDIRKQFREKAGLKPDDKAADDEQALPARGNSGHTIFAVKTGPDWDKPGTGSGKPGSGWEATGIPGTPGYEEPAVRLPLGPPRLDDPPHADPIRPYVIRLPAPSEDPVKLDPPVVIDPPAKVDPTVKRVIHRQITPWMFVNERDLRLNFDVTKQGSSGIKAVELWARRSSEYDYECADRMLGDQPPFVTRLWSEGNYEFRMVFESGAGGRTRMPTRYDLPDLYVCLDTTAPLVELLPPSAAENGVVNLRWKASDTNFAEQPICLQYSVDGKTWDPVGDKDCWLPNTGTYAWKVPVGLPHEVHLRVQARDRAGNVGEARSPSKFSVDLVLPEGKISGVVERGPEPRDARTKAEFPLKPRPGCERECVKVVVLTSTAHAVEPEYIGIDWLLFHEILGNLEKSCLDNGEDVRILKSRPLKDWKRENPNWRSMSAYDIGKHWNADYVIVIDVLDIMLFEPGTKREKLRGNATIGLTAFDLSTKSKDPAYKREFKTQSMASIAVADTSYSSFRERFIKQLTDDLIAPFIGCPMILDMPSIGLPAEQLIERELLPMPAVHMSSLPNIIQRITYVGADRISHDHLNELTGLRCGAPMNPALNEAARKKIRMAYDLRAYAWVTVKLTKGLDVNDTEVVFEIVEGLPCRVSAIEIRVTNEEESSAALDEGRELQLVPMFRYLTLAEAMSIALDQGSRPMPPWTAEDNDFCSWMQSQKTKSILSESGAREVVNNPTRSRHPASGSPELLSERHASFLEQLGPARSLSERSIPLSLELYFDYVPDGPPFQWQPPYLYW